MLATTENLEYIWLVQWKNLSGAGYDEENKMVLVDEEEAKEYRKVVIYHLLV